MHGAPDSETSTLGAVTVITGIDDEPAVLLSIKEAARLLSITTREVYHRLEAGDLIGVHLGRRHLVQRASLDAFVQKLIATTRTARTEN